MAHTKTAVTFAEAADRLGISHAALARALQRGEIRRAPGSPKARPLFGSAEVERYRERLAGQAAAGERPLDWELGEATTTALLLDLFTPADETIVAARCADMFRRLAGQACRAALVLLVNPDLEQVRAIIACTDRPGDDDLRAEVIDLPPEQYDGLRTGMLGAAIEMGESFASCDPEALLAGIVPPARARLLTEEPATAWVAPLLPGPGGALLVALFADTLAWDETRAAGLERLAHIAGAALQVARRQQRLVRRAARAEALQGAGRMLGRAVDMHDLLLCIAELAANLLAADAAAVFAADEPARRAGRLQIGGAVGLAGTARDWTATLTSEHLVGRVALAATPLQVTDAAASTGIVLPSLRGDRPARAALCAPIVNRGMLLGAIEVYSAEPRVFADDEVELLADVAEQAAIAIHALRGQESRQRALLGAVEALASSIEARDGYTGEHCKRAVHRATRVARALGLSDRDVETIGLAAALHDIGKIAVPDAILRKAGPLTPEETDVIRRHPEVGEQIVSWVPELHEVSRLVGAHQERWDGSGYPRGLAGDAIPIGARIISVVDAYAAMTEDRPYRRGRSHDAAIRELLRGRGTQFDPAVVDAFIHVIASAPHEESGLPDADRAEQALSGRGHQVEAAASPVTAGYLPVRRWQSRRASELAALNDILRAISSTLDLRRIYELVYRKVRDLVDVDAFMILQTAGGPAGEVTFTEVEHFPIIGNPIVNEIIAELERVGGAVVVADALARAGAWRNTPGAPPMRSAMAAPIYLGDELLGMISVQARLPERYDERHLGLLEEIALHIGLALRNAGVYAEARRRAEQFEAIGRLAARLNQLRDPTAIAQAFAAESRHVVHSEKCLVFFVEDDRHVLAAIEGDYTEAERLGYQDYSMPRGTGVLWLAVERGETLRIPDLSQDERVVPKVRAPVAGESGLIVPLAHEGTPLAVAFLVRSGAPFDETDAQAMNVLAAHAATAISDAISHIEAQRRVRELESLQRAVAIVSANLERKTAVKAIVEVLADVFGYGHVSMYSLEGDKLVLQAQVGYDNPIEELSIHHGILARCVRTGQSILLRDVSLDPEFVQAAHGLRSEVAVPVFVDGRVVGGVNVESDMSRELGEWDLALIELFSQQVGVAMANVSQYEQAVERATIDPVSRLPNHGALMERLQQAIRDARGRGAPLSVLFIDLDNFKRFNDAFGHRVGDRVLYAVGRHLEHKLPAGAFVARYGGEEFVALLPDTAPDSAQRVAEALRAQFALGQLEIAPGERFPVTVSIGVAGGEPVGDGLTAAEHLLDHADQAMYEAKRLGRNRVVRWSPGTLGATRP